MWQVSFCFWRQFSNNRINIGQVWMFPVCMTFNELAQTKWIAILRRTKKYYWPRKKWSKLYDHRGNTQSFTLLTTYMLRNRLNEYFPYGVLDPSSMAYSKFKASWKWKKSYKEVEATALFIPTSKFISFQQE